MTYAYNFGLIASRKTPVTGERVLYRYFSVLSKHGHVQSWVVADLEHGVRNRVTRYRDDRLLGNLCWLVSKFCVYVSLWKEKRLILKRRQFLVEVTRKKCKQFESIFLYFQAWYRYISYLCRQQYHYTKVRICAIPSPCGTSFSRNNIFLSSYSTFLPCANHVAVHDGTNCARDLVRYSTFGLCLSIELHSRPDAHPDTQPLGCNSNSNNESPN